MTQDDMDGLNEQMVSRDLLVCRILFY